MAFFIGRDREARRAYGFDEVALVPGTVTVNPEDTDVSSQIGSVKLQVPILASAMDGVVDVEFAIAMGRLGGVGVLNLDGVQTRYENPKPLFKKIAEATPEAATKLVQEIYKEPIKDKLVAQRVKEIKAAGVLCAVSSIPQNAERVGKAAADAGADLFVVQGTVTTARFKSSKGPVVDLAKFCDRMKIPVIIGNVVTYSAALELMETGAAALLVGVGPGAACTSRGVLGLGVPQVTATVDCAAARDFYFKKTGRYVSIITDGGMTTGGGRVQGVRFRGGRGDGGFGVRPGRRVAGTGISLGHGNAPPQSAPGNPRSGGHRGHAQTDPFWTGVLGRWNTELCGRDSHLHGGGGGQHHEGVPTDGNYYCPGN